MVREIDLRKELDWPPVAEEKQKIYMKPKVDWKDARKEWPSQPGTYWAIQHGKVGTKCLLFENDKRGITHWAEIEYPEPPEEKKVNELEKWILSYEFPLTARHSFEPVHIDYGKALARKLIEVMEERGYDHPHRAAGIDYNQGYIDGRQETINYIKRWCEEE